MNKLPDACAQRQTLRPPSPPLLRRARWLVGGWLLLSLAGLVALSLWAPSTALCAA